LVEEYLPLVRNVVGRVAMSLPSHVDSQDLYSAGLTGLLQALRQFNPAAGTAFEVYARVHIRGAIFDELRRMDWVPRSVHAKARRVQAARQALEQRQSRVPTETEMARALDLSVPEYRHLQEEVRPATFICLDAAVQPEHEDGLSHYESLPDHRQEDPHEGTARHELADMIAEQLQQLPDMQRQVLALYYFEDMRLREIALIFRLTESRICQIHAQALQSIKARLERFDPSLALAR
jgi:RNA polymerase sigma factor FliA